MAAAGGEGRVGGIRRARVAGLGTDLRQGGRDEVGRGGVGWGEVGQRVGGDPAR